MKLENTQYRDCVMCVTYVIMLAISIPTLSPFLITGCIFYAAGAMDAICVSLCDSFLINSLGPKIM